MDTKPMNSKYTCTSEHGADNSIMHRRLIISEVENVATETNFVMFSEKYPGANHHDVCGDAVDKGVMVMNFVDEDDLYPYRPENCVRLDISGVMALKSYRKVVKTPKGEDKEVPVVVLTRWMLQKLRRTELPVPTHVLQMMRDRINEPGNAILRALQDVEVDFPAPGGASRLARQAAASGPTVIRADCASAKTELWHHHGRAASAEGTTLKRGEMVGLDPGTELVHTAIAFACNNGSSFTHFTSRHPTTTSDCRNGTDCGFPALGVAAAAVRALAAGLRRDVPSLPQPHVRPGGVEATLVRLYGGCWRRCFLEKHAKEQRAEISVKVPNFSDVEAMRDVDKVVSDMFTIGEHRFCLWVFPNGNPNEAQYKGRVLSVYLVLTDLSRRPPDWLTCAVFSLQVENALDPRRRLEWHSCLTDNKFHKHLNNWGVHSLGSLGMLRDPQQGFLTKSAEGRAEPDTLTVSAQVRLMTITFRVVFEHDLREHHHLGLVDFSNVAELELPFCCSLRDLQVALHEKFLEVLGEYNEDESAMNQTRVWCFNQPVVSGQALRPRKLLTCDKAQQDRPLFGHLLCDGVDIDAYSFCQIYVEDNSMANDLPLDLPSSDLATAKDLKVAPEGYVFVKLLQPAPLNRLEYVGKVCIFDASSSKDIDMQNYSESGKLAPSVLYEAVAQKTGWSCAQLQMYREEIAPTVLSDVIPYHTSAVTAGLQPADIVVFIVRPEVPRELMTPRFRNPLFDLLLERYAEAWQLFNSDGLSLPTLEHVENLAEKLDIPKFRVRSAFRKCHEDAIATLRYIMEGRHLGFICDSCGETDFTGARYNCAVCSDYDLCAACNDAARVLWIRSQAPVAAGQQSIAVTSDGAQKQTSAGCANLM
ncbi:hypothetical protein ON010_g12677 [Phytophthora cinnamomi]|nr:hypothetical protein ON010_g12677 [Phytophthora cinnamomi]